jgi:hypothetical protein
MWYRTMASSISNPAGHPSKMPPTPLPWDSPKVVSLNIRPKVFPDIKQS